MNTQNRDMQEAVAAVSGMFASAEARNQAIMPSHDGGIKGLYIKFVKLRFFYRLWKLVYIQKKLDAGGKRSIICVLRDPLNGNMIAYRNGADMAIVSGTELTIKQLAAKEVAKQLQLLAPYLQPGFTIPSADTFFADTEGKGKSDN